MARWSFILIAAFAVASIFPEPAMGQFKIPKIKVPKIPQVETPSTATGTESSDRDTSSGNSKSSPAGSDEGSGVRGRPISGAKITFSNNPDGSNPKTSFTSAENIYGRIDFGGRTMYDAFGWKAMGNRDFYYVSYHVKILPQGSNQGWEHDWHNGRGYTLVTKEEAQKTYWNFDVLPEPSKASTRNSALADELQYYKGVAGMWPVIGRDVEDARRTFPQNGTYTVDITIFGDSYDDWGKPAGNYETYPTVSATFPFQFSGSDGQRMASGYQIAFDAIENAKSRQEMYKTMPDFWAKGIAPPDPKLAPARLVPMIKNYIGQWNLTYSKHMIYPLNGPAWAVEKNDLGIPRYRRFTSAIYIIYRDPKDSQCKVGYLEMHEPYAGGGTYAAPQLSGISDVKYIDCAAVK
jgi:hypothetical protein